MDVERREYKSSFKRGKIEVFYHGTFIGLRSSIFIVKRSLIWLVHSVFFRRLMMVRRRLSTATPWYQ